MNRPSLNSLRPMPLSYYSTRTKAIVAALLAAAIAAATILLWPGGSPVGQQLGGTPGQPGNSMSSHPSSHPSRVPDTVLKKMFTQRQELAANQTKAALTARATSTHTSAYQVLARLNRKGVAAVTVTDLARELKVQVSPAFTTVTVAATKAGATLTFTTPIRKDLPGTVLTVFKNGTPPRVTTGK